MGLVWGNERYTKGIMSLQILCLVNSSLPIAAAAHKGLKMARAQDGGAVGLGRDCRYARSNGAAVCVSASNPVWCCMGSSAVRYAERRETLGGICSILSCASAVDLPSAVVKGASQKGGV